VTALIPHLGYAAASAIAKAALAGDGDVRSLVLRTGVVDPALLDQLLDPERLAGVRA
jgi:aspartate ammonia-lyase